VVPSDDEAVLREQRAYYDARASEYDDGHQRIRAHDRGAEGNTSWFAEMDAVVDAFDRVPVRGDVLELAAGTGAWTERLVRRSDSLTVLDGSEAMLAVNRERLGAAAANVDYRIVDLFDWQPERQWDACVFGFWLCKVPDDRIAVFLSVVADALRPGGAVCCVDKTASVEPATELEDRTLNDGRRFTIIDHPRPPERLVEVFAIAGLSVEVETFGSRFSLVNGTRR
jgi:demethylmenaquinone methyltransferase/2-methoxy-6-polyprenyl-1,4-benzoquinol methylase